MSICVVSTPHTGHVYFARFGNIIKIGYARSVGHRLDIHRKEVKDIDFLFSVRGSFERERAFHLRFQQYRQKSKFTNCTRYAEHFDIPKDQLEACRLALSTEIGFTERETKERLTKQTITIHKNIVGHIRGLTIMEGKSFQEFVLEAIDMELARRGEPTSSELIPG